MPRSFLGFFFRSQNWFYESFIESCQRLSSWIMAAKNFEVIALYFVKCTVSSLTSKIFTWYFILWRLILCAVLLDEMADHCSWLGDRAIYQLENQTLRLQRAFWPPDAKKIASKVKYSLLVAKIIRRLSKLFMGWGQVERSLYLITPPP
jgi:hypothetical protein